MEEKENPYQNAHAESLRLQNSERMAALKVYKMFTMNYLTIPRATTTFGAYTLH